MKRDCQHGQLARSCELCEVTAQRDEALAQLAAKSKREATFAELLALDRKSTRLNSSHITRSRMPSSA